MKRKGDKEEVTAIVTTEKDEEEFTVLMPKEKAIQIVEIPEEVRL